MKKTRKTIPKPRKSASPRERPTRLELEEQLRMGRALLDDRRSKLEVAALRKSQHQLEVSRQDYLELFDLAPFAHLTLDKDGVIRNLNTTAAELLGLGRRELQGRPFQTLVARRDAHRLLRHLWELRHGQARASTELDLQLRGRPPLAVQIDSVVRHRAARSAEYWTAVMDITERKRAVARTAALAKLGLLLSAATEPAAAAQAVIGTAYEYCGWDACFLLLYKASTDTVSELVNMDTIAGKRVTVAPVLRGRSPTPLLRRVLEEGAQLILRNSPEEPGPETVRFGDTSRASLSLMLVPVRRENQAIGVLSVQSYEPHAYTQENLAVLQGLADHAGGTLARLEAQEALRRLTEQLEGRVVERTTELQEYRERLEELVKQRTSELEASNQQLRGEVAWRKQAEERLMRLTEDLQRSNEELEQYAYVISHDLQEPLRAVGGYVRLLEMRFPDKVDDQVREYIQSAAEGATRMEQQLVDLLTLSRVGRQELTLAPVDLAVPLNAALKNLEFSIEAAQAKVTVDPLPTLAVDETQFEQVFQNLIANALKFQGQRPPEIHVGARAEEGRWVVWVRDNGIGIAPQYAERIFQVFQRLHTRQKYPGTGIGLSICQKIVQRHGGRIWVESEPGHGATFFFAIPNTTAIVEAASSTPKG